MAPSFAVAVAVAAATALPRLAWAWGNEGHWISGRVADKLLGESARSVAEGILHGKDLDKIASWADEIRERPGYHWSAKLHYIDLPDKQCFFDLSHDCGEDQCVAGAILNYTRQLSDAGAAPEIREEALKFLVHFMGDIHQPLHVGWTSDRGGNLIHVEEGFAHDKKESLHVVWDTGILDEFEHEHDFHEDGYADMLITDASTWPEVAEWRKCGADVEACVLTMANESAALACEMAYRDESGSLVHTGEELSVQYYTSRNGVVSKRLAAAGVRLASVLDAVLTEKPIFA